MDMAFERRYAGLCEASGLVSSTIIERIARNLMRLAEGKCDVPKEKEHWLKRHPRQPDWHPVAFTRFLRGDRTQMRSDKTGKRVRELCGDQFCTVRHGDEEIATDVRLND